MRASLPLHELLRRIYRAGDVLARMEIAFGEQARFNLLRLIDMALAVDAAAGSARDLADELERVAVVGGEEEGALPHDEAGRVRVMTVHAAKGLEAPVVIIVDTAGDTQNEADCLSLSPHGPLVFGRLGELASGPARHDGATLPAPLAADCAAAAQRQITEEAHILYVAMTRARDRLFLLGAHGRAAPRRSYHAWLAAAATAAAAGGDHVAALATAHGGGIPGGTCHRRGWRRARRHRDRCHRQRPRASARVDTAPTGATVQDRNSFAAGLGGSRARSARARRHDGGR